MESNFIKPLDSFVDEVISYLPDYLRKDNLVKFMTIFLDRLEALDLSFIKLAEYRLLVNAQGVVLDDIGAQMGGLYRNGQSDDDFRTTLLIRQAAAGKGGTRSQIAESLSSIFSETGWEMYKGDNYRIDIYAQTPCFEIETVRDDIIELFPVITHCRIIESITNVNGFGFEGDPTASGFSSSNDRKSDSSGALLKIAYTSDEDINGKT
jgi:hypothetical protein